MSGKKVAVFVEFNYEDLELWYPLLRLREEGMTTFTVGPQKGTVYKSKHDYPAKADYGIDEISIKDFDALVIPGGWAPDYLRRDKRFVDLTRNAMEAGKIVATICHGGWMLCSAKCLKGKRATAFVAIKDDMENAGAIFEDSPVVVDGNLITSRIPSDLPDFCKAIIQKMK